MTGLLACVALSSMIQNPGVDDIVQSAFKDCRFEARVVKGNQRELKKINSDFAASYRFSFMKAQIKEPFKVRLESTVDDTNIVYLLVGTKRTYSIPRIKVNTTEDLSNSPGKRQTVLDFGILTPSLFKELFTAKFQRTDRETGDYVFDLTYQTPRFDDTSRHRVWVDPKHKFIKKRAWFNQEGRQLATFIYEEPKQEDGVWFPTRCTVKNVDDKVAGVTEYRSMSINVGLQDSVFKI